MWVVGDQEIGIPQHGARHNDVVVRVARDAPGYCLHRYIHPLGHAIESRYKLFDVATPDVVVTQFLDKLIYDSLTHE